MTTSPDPPPTPPPVEQRERRPRLLLTDSDFDAPRPRPELKPRMLRWARDVVARLREIGVVVEASTSDDARQVFFWRDAVARRQSPVREPPFASEPGTRHAFLTLKIDDTCVEVAFALHPEAWVDVKNLRARLADATRALQLTSALEALPEEFTLSLAADGERTQARRVETLAIRGLLERGDAEKSALWLGWRIPREVAVAHAAMLDEQLEDAIVALGPVYKLVAWAQDNDLLVLDREVDAAKAERARHNEEEERARAESHARRAEERKPKKRMSIPRTAQEGHRRPRGDFLREGDAEPTTDRTAADAAAKDAATALPPKRALPKKQTRTFPRRAPLVTEVDPSIVVDKGVRVRVLGGPFAGKVGVVQELDGKGSARVMLGLLAMWLEVRDLIASAEGRDRPVLASSHRKIPPGR